MELGELVWENTTAAQEGSGAGRFLAAVNAERDSTMVGYDDLWRWSVDEVGDFWDAVARFFGVRFLQEATGPTEVRGVADVDWFPGARISYAEHALRGSGPGALVGISQTRGRVSYSWDELRLAVAQCRQALADHGVGIGDRVAAYLPNVPEAVIAYLATASLGAVWSSCSPEFGVRGATDRFGQISPTVLLAVDGYEYGTKTVDRRAEIDEIRAALPSVTLAVGVPYLGADPFPTGWTPWSVLLDNPARDLVHTPVPFDHPMAILFSSGTTGLPKPIVHGHGGLLLEHLKLHGLQHDLGPDDRFAWLSTTGWVMWNISVSGLLVGSTVVLWDGSFAHPDPMQPWRFCQDERISAFGVSAGYLLAARKAGLSPRDEVDLSALRMLGSTGSPLPVEGYEWVYEEVKRDVALVSLSGGTDIATAFMGGSPLVPVYAGEMSCCALGVDAVAYDEHGAVLVDREGELVVRTPMPSMPVGFWGDDDGERMRRAYFTAFPGVWHHGDWILFRPRGSSIISGRSDSTLNRGGVRLGTAELYGVVEDFPEIADSLVVSLDDGPQGPGRLLLLVVLADGARLDGDLRARIAATLRADLSARHVPDDVLEITAVPRTASGKKLEVPVKRVLQGAPLAEVTRADSVADASAFDAVVRLAEQMR